MTSGEVCVSIKKVNLKHYLKDQLTSWGYGGHNGTREAGGVQRGEVSQDCAESRERAGPAAQRVFHRASGRRRRGRTAQSQPQDQEVQQEKQQNRK